MVLNTTHVVVSTSYDVLRATYAGIQNAISLNHGRQHTDEATAKNVQHFQ
ncbi:hypothetical protein SDC9_131861 [bioreactor metagenome]|uniref:Uncharacterized protein n=1 Tax=bioreactor metagenome TaxID=1076179 RepID=A0A645D6G7_9ZZZZ